MDPMTIASVVVLSAGAASNMTETSKRAITGAYRANRPLGSIGTETDRTISNSGTR